MPIGAIIGGASSLLGGLIGGIGASSAAKQQAAAAQAAQQQITQAGQQARSDVSEASSAAQKALAAQYGPAQGYLSGGLAGAQGSLSPYTNIGAGATTQLGNLLTPTAGPTSGGFQTGTGGLLEGWNQQFQAPTVAQLNDPNNPLAQQFQFITQQGDQALQNSAAARGDLFSSNTQKSLANYNQGAASQYAQQQYSNALQQYQQAYGQFQTNQANTFNRLAGIAGMGQGSASQLAGLQAGIGSQQAGLATGLGQGQANLLFGTGQQLANIGLGTAQDIAQTIEQQGAARASGSVGLANALSGGIGNAGQTVLLSSLLNQNQGGPQNASGYGGPIGAMPAPNAIPGSYNPWATNPVLGGGAPNVGNDSGYQVPMLGGQPQLPFDEMSNVG